MSPDVGWRLEVNLSILLNFNAQLFRMLLELTVLETLKERSGDVPSFHDHLWMRGFERCH